MQVKKKMRDRRISQRSLDRCLLKRLAFANHDLNFTNPTSNNCAARDLGFCRSTSRLVSTSHKKIFWLHREWVLPMKTRGASSPNWTTPNAQLSTDVPHCTIVDLAGICFPNAGKISALLAKFLPYWQKFCLTGKIYALTPNWQNASKHCKTQ